MLSLQGLQAKKLYNMPSRCQSDILYLNPTSSISLSKESLLNNNMGPE